MNVEESIWQPPDRCTLFIRRWQSAQQPKATIILVHGLGEHSGRYHHLAEFFNAAGYAVTAFDLRGHGNSQGVRGHADSYEVILDDLHHFVEEASQSPPGLPLFLYGHSLGGALVLCYLLCGRQAVTAAVVTSPALAPAKPPSSFKLAAARVLSRLAPSFTLSNDLDVSGLSRDPVIVERYRQDPLVHNRISARLGMELISNGQWILTQSTVKHPVLILQAGEDRVVDSTKTDQLAQTLKGKITYKRWEGLYHELHNEPEKETVLNDILNWLEARATRKCAPPHHHQA